jgi:hypothetical protein
VRGSVTFTSGGAIRFTVEAENEAEQRILFCLKGRDRSSLIETWHEGHETNGRIRRAEIVFMGKQP